MNFMKDTSHLKKRQNFLHMFIIFFTSPFLNLDFGSIKIEPKKLLKLLDQDYPSHSKQQRNTEIHVENKKIAKISELLKESFLVRLVLV